MSFISPPIDYIYDHLALIDQAPQTHFTATVTGNHNLDVIPDSNYSGYVNVYLHLLTAAEQNVADVVLRLVAANGQIIEQGSVVVSQPVVQVDISSGVPVFTLINASSYKGNPADWFLTVEGGIGGGIDDADVNGIIWRDITRPFTLTQSALDPALAAAGGGSYAPADYAPYGSGWQFAIGHNPGSSQTDNQHVFNNTPKVYVSTAHKINGAPFAYPVDPVDSNATIRVRAFGLEAVQNAYFKFQWKLDSTRRATPATFANFVREFTSKTTTAGAHSVTLLGVDVDDTTTELGTVNYSF